MITFLVQLADILEEESENWRTEYVFVLDGASYHKSKETRAAYRKLGMQVILLGPYSFTGATIELWFAALKTGDLNPTREALGKR